MNIDNYFSNSQKIVGQAVERIIAAGEKRIQMNKFIKRYEPGFIVKSQENIYNSNLKHILNKPEVCIRNEEMEPKNIQEDNFMNVGCTNKEINKKQISQNNLSSNKKSVGSVIQTKRSQQNKKNGKGNKNKQVLLSKFQFLIKQQKNGQIQEEQWRLRKEEDDRIARESRPLERPKKQCRLEKGEQVFFDFQGNFDKRKDNPSKDFVKTVLQGNLLNPTHLYRHQHKNHEPSQTTVQANNRKVEKGQYSKLRSNEDQQYMRQLSQNRNNKQQLLNSLSICSEGIKVLIDGVAVKNSSTQKSRKSDSYNNNTVVLKKIKDSISERFKTESIYEADIVLPNLKKKCLELKNRNDTQINKKKSSFGKISIENMSLHKMVVNGEQGQNRYIGIPSKHSIRRRLKTNVDSSSMRRDQQIQKLKIKDRLTNLMRQGDRLPKIINQHLQVQAQLYRELRQKLKDEH